MAESAFEAMPAYLRERALDEVLRADFLVPVHNDFLRRFFWRQTPPPGGPLCRRQPEALPAGWDPGKLAKIYDPDKFYWWRGGSIRKPASQPGAPLVMARK